MNDLFKKRQIDFLIQLISLGLLLFGIHSYLNFHFMKEITLFFPLWHIYLFHTITIILIYSLINYRDANGKTQVFNTFVVGMLLKMVLVMVFLLPWLISKPEQKGYDLINFFAPYFLFLAFDVYSITKITQKNS